MEHQTGAVIRLRVEQAPSKVEARRAPARIWPCGGGRPGRSGYAPRLGAEWRRRSNYHDRTAGPKPEPVVAAVECSRLQKPRGTTEWPSAHRWTKAGREPRRHHRL